VIARYRSSGIVMRTRCRYQATTHWLEVLRVSEQIDASALLGAEEHDAAGTNQSTEQRGDDDGRWGAGGAVAVGDDGGGALPSEEMMAQLAREIAALEDSQRALTAAVGAITSPPPDTRPRAASATVPVGSAANANANANANAAGDGGGALVRQSSAPTSITTQMLGRTQAALDELVAVRRRWEAAQTAAAQQISRDLQLYTAVQIDAEVVASAPPDCDCTAITRLDNFASITDAADKDAAVLQRTLSGASDASSVATQAGLAAAISRRDLRVYQSSGDLPLALLTETTQTDRQAYSRCTRGSRGVCGS
jgi:F0F1-type ATP synthase membrane subunit c/vacuolar-type H+-ATPase subunit K